ncbi:MAG: hypothetical protein FWD61_13095 [Phycisphaerales bacterium]|nr:hypothetical protein [Phycisphaerales bacterium]
MTVKTFEAVVHHGTIRLPDDVLLRENARVFVVVPDMRDKPTAYLASPHLANPDLAKDFRKQILEIPSDAKL